MIETEVDKKYEELFDFLCDCDIGEFDLLVEIKVIADGKTIRRSWSERDKWLIERNGDYTNR